MSDYLDKINEAAKLHRDPIFINYELEAAQGELDRWMGKIHYGDFLTIISCMMRRVYKAGADFVLKNPPPEWQKVSVWDEKDRAIISAKSFFKAGWPLGLHTGIMFYDGQRITKEEFENFNPQQRQITDLTPKELLQNEKVRELVEALKFYKDKNNWERIDGHTKWASNLNKQDCAMLNCGGGRARLALADWQE